MSKANTSINKILINKVRRKYLQLISTPFGHTLRHEQSRISMDPIRHRFHAQNRIIRLRRHGVLHSVEELSRRNRWLLAQMLHVALELGRWQVRVDPVVLQVPGIPKRTARFRLRRFSRLPNTNHPLRQKLRNSLAKNTIVLVDQILSQILLQILLELRRVVVSELGPNLENYDLRLCLGEELLDVLYDDVYAVSGEDSVADSAVFLDSDVENSGASYELVVDRERLALSEGASYEREADLVRCGVVGPGPDDLVYVEFFRVEVSHPVLSVRWTVIASRKSVAAVSLQIAERLLLRRDRFSSIHLL